MENRAGDQTICDRQYFWFARGDWNVQSKAAPSIAHLRYQLATTLRAILGCYEPRTPELEEMAEDLDVGWTVNRVTAARARLLLSSFELYALWGRLPRVPLTNDEVKNRRRIIYHIDELRALQMPQDGGSESARICWKLRITRNAVALALEGLAEVRANHVVL